MTTPAAILPPEGWHVIHLFYRVEHGQWQLFTENEKIRAKTRLAELVQEIRSTPDTQLILGAMVTPKADIGFMLMTPDLQAAHAWEKQLSLALGADVLSPAGAFLSMTERGEPDDGAQVQPALPDWPVFCFYAMLRRRRPGQNWYALAPEARRELLAAQAAIDSRWQGKILRLVTGAAGLDDAEWGVTLFAHGTHHLKALAAEERFHPSVAEYVEYGEFFIGLQLPLDELYRRVQL